MDITDDRQLQALARDRRLSLGLSQETVAHRSGVSRKWVSDFERGKTSADLSLVFSLLKTLDLQVQVVYPVDSATEAPRPFSGHEVDLDDLLDGGRP